MQRMEFSEQTAWKGAYVTVGSFDGVHRGHRHLLVQMVRAAQEDHAPAVVLTFFPHPRTVWNREPDSPPFHYLTTLNARVGLLESTGLDAVITLRFDPAFARTPAAEFLEMLRQRLGMRALWCGPGFTFGHQREGDVAFLTQHSVAMGFMTYVLPPLLEGGEPVSSTRVRRTLAEGDTRSAARLLGRPYSLGGRVIQGAGRGRGIGFPTANLEPWEEIVVPGSGIYTTMVTHQGRRYPSVTSIGIRPTFAENNPATTIETYVIGFSGDLYGADLVLEFRSRLRGEQRFDGVDALRVQIQKDVEQARLILQEEE